MDSSQEFVALTYVNHTEIKRGKKGGGMLETSAKQRRGDKK